MDRLNPVPGEGPSWLRPGVARALEGQVIPRLLARHRPLAVPAGEAMGARWLAGLSLSDDDSGLADAVHGLHCQGIPVDALQLDWLGPAAAELGAMWGRDQISFSDVTIGLVRLQSLARRLPQPLATGLAGVPPCLAPRVLLALMPGEQHSFGLSLLGDAFRRAGWEVVLASTDVSPATWVARRPFDVVGLSVGSLARAPAVPALCAALRRASREPGLRVMVGGPLFSLPELPGAPTAWGADAVALDAREAVALASSWLAPRGDAQGAPPGVQDTVGR
ncbi:MAG: cobalamin B12-binding domain-containing protein [Rubrivivax sp.]|nr:cobalamin B12-binding domain-containing protein [Rubrivivax sp.]